MFTSAPLKKVKILGLPFFLNAPSVTSNSSSVNLPALVKNRKRKCHSPGRPCCIHPAVEFQISHQESVPSEQSLDKSPSWLTDRCICENTDRIRLGPRVARRMKRETDECREGIHRRSAYHRLPKLAASPF